MQDFPRIDDIDRDFGQFHGNFRELIDTQAKSARIDLQVLTLDKALPPKLIKNRDILRRTVREVAQEAEAVDSPRLLGTQPARPGQSRAAKERDETASVDYSITSSAKARAARNTLRARAVRREDHARHR